MSVIFHKSPGEIQDIWREILTLKPLVLELWDNYIVPSYFDIREIIAGNYISHGGSGEGEPFGVPTEAEIRAIIEN